MALEVDTAQGINGRFLSILMMIINNHKKPFRVGHVQHVSTSRCACEECWGWHAY